MFLGQRARLGVITLGRGGREKVVVGDKGSCRFGGRLGGRVRLGSARVKERRADAFASFGSRLRA